MFNKSEIMQHAWEIVISNRNWKILGASFHLCRALWAAWAEAKRALLTSVQKRVADLRSSLTCIENKDRLFASDYQRINTLRGQLAEAA